MLTQDQCNKNAEFFTNQKQMLHDKEGSLFIHKESGLHFYLENNKYVVDTCEKLCMISALCPLEWVMRNVDLSQFSKDDKRTLFSHVMTTRGF